MCFRRGEEGGRCVLGGKRRMLKGGAENFSPSCDLVVYASG